MSFTKSGIEIQLRLIANQYMIICSNEDRRANCESNKRRIPFKTIVSCSRKFPISPSNRSLMEVKEIFKALGLQP